MGDEKQRQPTFKDIKAKNAQFAASARENAGKPRIRNSAKDATAAAESDASTTYEAKTAQAKRARTNVRPARKDRLSQNKVVGAGLSNNKLALGLIVFVVCGGGKFLLRLV